MFYMPITDFWTDNAEIELKAVNNNAEIPLLKAKCENDLIGKIENADAILAGHTISITKKTISSLKKCKSIVRYGVGYDNIDFEFAAKLGIPVCNVPDYGTDVVADHTLSLILSLSRNTVFHTMNIFNNNKNCWNTFNGGQLKRSTETTLGIIGLGRIGTAVALRAKAFGMNIIFYDPYVECGKDKSLMIKRAETLKELAENSDIITIHTPLTNETKYMINKKFFNYCKKEIILINTARGSIININELYDAMKNKTVIKAGFDVLEEEPINRNIPLFKAWFNNENWIKGKIIITPHSASNTYGSFYEMRYKTAQEAYRACLGKPLLNCINM